MRARRGRRRPRSADRRRGRPGPARRRRGPRGRHARVHRRPRGDQRGGRRCRAREGQARRPRAGEGLPRHPHRSRRRSPEGGVRLMFYHLFFGQLHTAIPVFNVFRYITFRTAGASVTAVGLSLVLGPWMIRRLRDFQIGQVIRQDGPQTHRAKAGTPTMGGLLIVACAILPTLLWANLRNAYIWIAVIATTAFGAVGFADDYLKIVRRSHHGLWPRYKMAWQAVIGVGVGVALLVLVRLDLYNTHLLFPFFKRLIPDLGCAYVLFAAFVCVAWTHAVNLTDGLDGLAISVFGVAAAALTALTYVSCHPVFAEYLLIARGSPLTGELPIFCGALVGASLGFLWYNSYPADIFMGDVGSLA